MADPIRIVIVGGVAGGASAATRARRLSETAEITVFERGPHVSFANCGLPYHVAGVITDRNRLLVQTPESLRARFGLDVRVNTEVLRIDREAKEVVVHDRTSGREYRQPYDALVLSPGAEPIRPPMAGVNDPRVLTLRNLEDMDRILEIVDRDGLSPRSSSEAGTSASRWRRRSSIVARRVVLVERLPHVMGVADPEMVAPLHEELRRNGVDLRLGVSVEAIDAQADRLRGAALGRLRSVVRPRPSRRRRPPRDQARARGGAGDRSLRRHPRGRTHAHQRPGDLGGRGRGRGDGLRAAGARSHPAGRPRQPAGPHRRRQHPRTETAGTPGTQGTAICKVFDLAFAMTGASEAGLRARRQAVPPDLRPPGRSRDVLSRRATDQPEAAVRSAGRRGSWARRPWGRAGWTSAST